MRKEVVVGKLAGRLSRLGQRWNSERLTYNPLLILHFHWMARAAAPGLVSAMRELVPDARLVGDIGAGSGAYAAEASRQGLSVIACERSWTGRFLARRQGIHAEFFDLERHPPADLPNSIDMAYCLEVAEHLAPPLGDRLVDYLSELAPLVIFSAATPGQGGHGHINEQQHSYWIQRFGAHGLALDHRRTARLRAQMAVTDAPWWLKANLMVFSSPVG